MVGKPSKFKIGDTVILSQENIAALRKTYNSSVYMNRIAPELLIGVVTEIICNFDSNYRSYVNLRWVDEKGKTDPKAHHDWACNYWSELGLVKVDMVERKIVLLFLV